MTRLPEWDEFALPYRIKEAGAVSKDHALWDWEVLTEAIRQSDFWEDLERATFVGDTTRENDWFDEDGNRKPHCPLKAGSDILAWVAFRNSGETNLKTWLKRTRPEMWEAFGYEPDEDGDPTPNYHTLRRRFNKLWSKMDAIEAAAAKLFNLIADNEPAFGRDIFTDATDELTAADLIHDCQPGKDGEPGECPLEKEGQPLGKFARALRIHKADPTEAAEHRDENVQAERPPVGVHEAEGEASHLVTGNVQFAGFVHRKDGQGTHLFMRLKTESHYYITRDFSAGVRMYEHEGKTNKAWHGRLVQRAVDASNGLEVAVQSFPCTETERQHIETLLNKAEHNTGRPFRSVGTDKGLTDETLTEKLSRREITHVIPRKSHPTLKTPLYDLDWIDQDDVVRCKYCHHETERITWFIDPENGEPTQRVQCVAGTHPACYGVQEYRVKAWDWTRLLPITRTDSRYMVLAYLRNSHERSHHLARLRNRVANNTKQTAPRQIGWLRSNADAITGMFLDALRYCLRMGYVPSPTGTRRRVKVCTPIIVTYEKLVAKLRDKMFKRRREALLHLPYGEGTEAWGGDPLPPSRRKKEDGPPDRASP